MRRSPQRDHDALAAIILGFSISIAPFPVATTTWPPGNQDLARRAVHGRSPVLAGSPDPYQASIQPSGRTRIGATDCPHQPRYPGSRRSPVNDAIFGRTLGTITGNTILYSGDKRTVQNAAYATLDQDDTRRIATCHQLADIVVRSDVNGFLTIDRPIVNTISQRKQGHCRSLESRQDRPVQRRTTTQFRQARSVRPTAPRRNRSRRRLGNM